MSPMKRSLQSDPAETNSISVCSSGEDLKGIYGREGLEIMAEAMEDDDCCVGGGEEMAVAAGGGMLGGSCGEKKRRLSVEQVRALEKNFEVENKLEPERKVRLAQELGLQPRQVAVWFQNRRARWKTKQLERDYAALKGSYDALRLDYDSLSRDKESLMAEIKELKRMLKEEEEEESLSFSPVKEEPAASETETKVAAVSSEEPPPALIRKDGSSSVDSDSSAVLNDENINYGGPGMSSSTTTASDLLSAASFGGSTPFPAVDLLPFMLNSESMTSRGGSGLFYQQHALKMEENEFFSGEDPCSRFFSDEQPPALNWYYSDHWN